MASASGGGGGGGAATGESDLTSCGEPIGPLPGYLAMSDELAHASELIANAHKTTVLTILDLRGIESLLTTCAPTPDFCVCPEISFMVCSTAVLPVPQWSGRSQDYPQAARNASALDK